MNTSQSEQLRKLLFLTPVQSSKIGRLISTATQRFTKRKSQYKEYELMDGTKVVIDKLEVGGKVLIDGKPAEMGAYQLKDETIVYVIANPPGEIASITDGSEKTEYAKFIHERDRWFENLADKMEDQKARLEQAKRIAASQGAFLKKLHALVQDVANMPTTNPPGALRKSNSGMVVTTREQERAKLLTRLEFLKQEFNQLHV